MAQLTRSPVRVVGKLEQEVRSFKDSSIPDTDLSDLIHSWKRLEDPDLRRMAIRFIRMLGEDHVREQQVHCEVL